MTYALKALRNFTSNIGLTGKLVSQENWVHTGTYFSGKLIFQGNWFRWKTDFAGKSILKGN